MELYQVCTGRAWGGGGAGKGVARWSYTRCVQEGHGVVVVLVKGWPGGVIPGVYRKGMGWWWCW